MWSDGNWCQRTAQSDGCLLYKCIPQSLGSAYKGKWWPYGCPQVRDCVGLLSEISKCFCISSGKRPKKMVTKRFIFSPWNIAAHRARCSSEEYLRNPSSPVEYVSALIWRCAANAARKKIRSVTTKTVAKIIVNKLGKVDPPLLEDSVGNSVIVTMNASAIDSGADLDGLAGQLRVAIQKIDGDYVKEVQTEEGFTEFIDSYKQIEDPFTKGEVEMYTISSWMRFPFYEVDFGWGAPTWACSAGLPGKNIIALMDSKNGNGIEAWIALDEEDMSIFEPEPELIPFASGN